MGIKILEQMGEPGSKDDSEEADPSSRKNRK